MADDDDTVEIKIRFYPQIVVKRPGAMLVDDPYMPYALWHCSACKRTMYRVSDWDTIHERRPADFRNGPCDGKPVPHHHDERIQAAFICGGWEAAHAMAPLWPTELWDRGWYSDNWDTKRK